MAKPKSLTPHAFLKRVKDTIKHYEMLEKGDRVLVAVSGGADSVCLLKVLYDMRRRMGIELVVGNLDHSLRGAESAEESRFVKRLAKEMALECVHKKINVKACSKRGISTEEKAREKRYAFFEKAAKDKKCNVIATGHTIDDQAETVLMRVVYGSSFKGLTGIPPVREDGAFKIVRPLIRTERKDLDDFLKKMKMAHIEDSSNQDQRFVRNRIRHQLLPFLEGYNPKVKRTLTNLADTLREDLVFMEQQKNGIIEKKMRPGATSVKIKDIMLQPKTVRKEMLKDLFREAGGNVKKLTYRHWMDMDRFVRASGGKCVLDLPGNIRIDKKNDTVRFCLKKI